MWIDLPLSAKKEMDTARHDITASIHAVNHVLVSVCSMFAEVSPLTLSHAMQCHVVMWCGVVWFGLESRDLLYRTLSVNQTHNYRTFPFPSLISATRTMWPQSMRSPPRPQRHHTGMTHRRSPGATANSTHY